jgi:hypothetical protein
VHRLSNVVLLNCVTIVQTQTVGSLEGSPVFRLVVGVRSELRELQRQDQDLRHQRIWQLLSIWGLVGVDKGDIGHKLASTFHCDRCRSGIADCTS